MLLSGSILDTVLLVRVLGLRLQRTYLFITLDCVLSPLIDWVSVYLGWDSPESTRVFIYTRFLYAVLTPLIAWDVFEEIKRQASKVRWLEATRMVLSLLIMGAFSFLLLTPAIFGGSEDAGADWAAALGLYLWGVACVAAILFIWRTRRAARKQEIGLPRNTTVWSIYYMLTLLSSVVVVGIAFSGWKVDQNVLNIVLVVWGMGCTIYCVLRLRGAPPELTIEGRD